MPNGGLSGNRAAARVRPSAFILILAAALAAAFLGVGATRCLHFDETLVLRAGWLLTGRVPAEPPFAMPATLLAGAATRTVGDPGALFLLLRFATGAAVLWALAWAARRACASRGRAAGAVCLSLLSYAFVAHGIEFRYDAAILVGLLVAFGLLVRGRETDFAALGAAAAFVAAHHVKGLLFGAVLLSLGALRAGGDRRRLIRLAAGTVAATGLWIATAGVLGAWPDVVRTVVTFTRLGATGVRQAPWAAPIARTFQLDAAFWAAAILAAGLAVRDVARRRPETWREEPVVWTILFLALTLGFPFLHPMPWPYMLALPAPFAAILLAEATPGWFEGARRTAAMGACAAVVAAQTFLLQAPVGAAWWASLAAPREPEVEALRSLRRLAAPGERVFDPSGLAYFLPPCTRQWYVDTLFEPGTRAGTWMADAATLEPGACAWVVFTYRLGMLPEPVRARLGAGWERRGFGLGLRRGDPRIADLPPSRRGDDITTFW